MEEEEKLEEDEAVPFVPLEAIFGRVEVKRTQVQLDGLRSIEGQDTEGLVVICTRREMGGGSEMGWPDSMSLLVS